MSHFPYSSEFNVSFKAFCLFSDLCVKTNRTLKNIFQLSFIFIHGKCSSFEPCFAHMSRCASPFCVLDLDAFTGLHGVLLVLLRLSCQTTDDIWIFLSQVCKISINLHQPSCLIQYSMRMRAIVDQQFYLEKTVKVESHNS